MTHDDEQRESEEQWETLHEPAEYVHSDPFESNMNKDQSRAYRAFKRYKRGTGRFTMEDAELLASVEGFPDSEMKLAMDFATGEKAKPAARPTVDANQDDIRQEARRKSNGDKFIPEFSIITPATAKLRPVAQFLIPDVVRSGETSLWYGQPKSNKSTLLGDAYFHAALGWDWMGKKLKRRMNCVFVAAERSEVTEQRLIAFMRDHNVKSRDFPFTIIVSDGLNMLDPDHQEGLRNRLFEIADYWEMPIDMIGIDTLTQTFGGGNQNESVDMTAYGNACVMFRKSVNPDSHLHIVHHESKPDSGERYSSGGPKGAIDLLGIVEGAFQVREEGPDDERYRELHVFRHNKMKAGRLLAFSYDVVSAGFTTDSATNERVEVEEIVCRPSEFREFAKQSGKGKGKGGANVNYGALSGDGGSSDDEDIDPSDDKRNALEVWEMAIEFAEDAQRRIGGKREMKPYDLFLTKDHVRERFYESRTRTGQRTDTVRKQLDRAIIRGVKDGLFATHYKDKRSFRILKGMENFLKTDTMTDTDTDSPPSA